MKKLRWLAILMGMTILGVAGFQGYWLNDNYDREKQNLEIKTNSAFHQTILRLQSSKLNLEKMSLQFDSATKPVNAQVVVQPRRNLRRFDSTRVRGKRPPISMITLLQEKMRENGDSLKTHSFVISGKDGFVQRITVDSITVDSLTGTGPHRFKTKIESLGITKDSLTTVITKTIDQIPRRTIKVTYDDKNSDTFSSERGVFIERPRPPETDDHDILLRAIPHDSGQRNAVFRFLYNVDSISLKDSVTVKEIVSSFTNKLKEENISGLRFSVSRLDSSFANSANPNDVTIGFVKPITYRLSLDNSFSYLLKQLTLPILFSLLLVGITIVSFVLLYRNLVKQRRLAELKNEFISNITHELKTPIATVGVAIEALKNFNAIHDPKRTQEYLDISQSELQRLTLLVDKVLKLSMFEKKELELKKEQFDCRQLVEEVMTSMRLQFEKYHAKAQLHTTGDNFIVEADKLHITSVIYNLLDNALKYSKETPVIEVQLAAHPDNIEISVSDNGIGIESAYKEKIFDKFFRVPTGDKHNIKGYGLGLSYVAEVVKRHHGNIHVVSELGKGSTFTARFPYV